MKIILTLFLFLYTQLVLAVDTYNPVNGQLTVPIVYVGNTVYINVVLTVDQVISVGQTTNNSNDDSYDVSSGQLTIPSVLVGNTLYKNVVCTFKQILSIGGLTDTSRLGDDSIAVKKNYKSTSYALAQSSLWLSSSNLYNADGSKVTDNALQVSHAQVDLNGDDIEDVLYYKSYSLSASITNPPPVTFINHNGILVSRAWNGVTMRKPHPVKILIGDYDGDGYPDLFNLVAIDPPFGAFPDLLDFNSVLFGSSDGFQRIKEFDDKLGFWYAGASGDIRKNGSLDIVMFNFHTATNGVKNQILRNDGKGNFTFDTSGIGDIPGVDLAELIDMNGDGYLDLVIDNVANNVAVSSRNISILWGSSSGNFSLANSVSIPFRLDLYPGSLNFFDVDNDGFMEIIVAGSDGSGTSAAGLGNYFVKLFKSINRGVSYSDLTSTYFDISQISQRFDHLKIDDIDGNGLADLVATDRSSGIRWEWNGTKFIKK
jgi:hypothetical protein